MRCRDFHRVRPCWKRCLRCSTRNPSRRSRARPCRLEGPGQLEFENVTLSYGPHRAALRGVSFKVPAGKTVGIVGASGSGKSTLVRLLVRLLEPDAGRILLDGVPISALSLATLRQSIAVVPQDTVLFNDSVGDNIAFGKADCTQEEIEQAASRAHLHELHRELARCLRYERRGERAQAVGGRTAATVDCEGGDQAPANLYFR